MTKNGKRGLIGGGVVILFAVFLFPVGSVSEPSGEDRLVVGDFADGLDRSGIPEGWQLDQRRRPVSISLEEKDGRNVLRFVSENSAFGLVKRLNFDIRDYPYLNWEWKAVRLPEGGDFRDRSTDDQAGQVYVVFGRFALTARAVGYYWENLTPVGYEGVTPTWGRSRAIVLQSGRENLGRWMKERRNVYEDYVRLFGDEDPSNIRGLRLYINTQQTGTSGEILYRDIYFSRE